MTQSYPKTFRMERKNILKMRRGDWSITLRQARPLANHHRVKKYSKKIRNPFLSDQKK